MYRYQPAECRKQTYPVVLNMNYFISIGRDVCDVEDSSSRGFRPRRIRVHSLPHTSTVTNSAPPNPAPDNTHGRRARRARRAAPPCGHLRRRRRRRVHSLLPLHPRCLPHRPDPRREVIPGLRRLRQGRRLPRPRLVRLHPRPLRARACLLRPPPQPRRLARRRLRLRLPPRPHPLHLSPLPARARLPPPAPPFLGRPLRLLRSAARARHPGHHRAGPPGPLHQGRPRRVRRRGGYRRGGARRRPGRARRRRRGQGSRRGGRRRRGARTRPVVRAVRDGEGGVRRVRAQGAQHRAPAARAGQDHAARPVPELPAGARRQDARPRGVPAAHRGGVHLWNDEGRGCARRSGDDHGGARLNCNAAQDRREGIKPAEDGGGRRGGRGAGVLPAVHQRRAAGHWGDARGEGVVCGHRAQLLGDPQCSSHRCGACRTHPRRSIQDC